MKMRTPENAAPRKVLLGSLFTSMHGCQCLARGRAYVCVRLCARYLYYTSDCECEFMILRNAFGVFGFFVRCWRWVSCHRYKSADAVRLLSYGMLAS